MRWRRGHDRLPNTLTAVDRYATLAREANAPEHAMEKISKPLMSRQRDLQDRAIHPCIQR